MPGGVAFHCGGRDRAGQITLVLLALLGVAPSDIAADYMLSYERVPARYGARGEPDQGPLLQAFLADRGTTASDIIIDTARVTRRRGTSPNRRPHRPGPHDPSRPAARPSNES